VGWFLISEGGNPHHDGHDGKDVHDGKDKEGKSILSVVSSFAKMGQIVY
jgi:hypothetical protein